MMPSLFRAATLAALVAFVASPAAAQVAVGADSVCFTPDSILVRGTVRTSAADVILHTGLVARRRLSGVTDLQRAIQAIYAMGDFDSVTVSCVRVASDRSALAFHVVERPTLSSIKVDGTKAISMRTVEDRIELLLRRPVEPSLVARAITRIDSLYAAAGYQQVRVRPETTVVAEGSVAITFHIEEGRRMAISGLEVIGNKLVSASDIAAAMKTRPEGFMWFRKGEYDPEKYAADLGELLPAFFATRGFIDFHILSDTLIVDRERGKGYLRLTISEGPQYKIGTFTMSGNQHFTDEQIRRFYPFRDDGLTLAQRALNAARGRRVDPNVFDQLRWEEATRTLGGELYANDGYVYTQINPVIERAKLKDSTSVVNLRWQIDERSPAIVNRIDIEGNDYTTEQCIRDMIVLPPGSVFNRTLLMQSYQGIGNLGFFEAPLPFPETPVANEHGDLNVIFRVKEKRTGTVNFGASMGQGVGVGGFIGLEQPNLFGRCKRGSLNWQFGRYLNDFNLGYTDPSIRLTRLSGTISAYRSQARYQIADLGQNTRTGGSLRLGLPMPGSRYTRIFMSYTGEAVKFGTSGLLGTVNDCSNCFRSAVGVDITRDRRFGLPFPYGGAMQSISASFNGGPLGGSASFQRYTSEYRAFAPLASFGGGGTKGGEPMQLTLGLSARTGAVFGNTGPFFFSQRFALGGVQFGEPLRGYPEFSITPRGFLTGTSTYSASRESFGSAYLASTLELGLRFNSQFYVNLFYDAGNVWERPRDFDPTRLFRGAGIGLSTVTPLGPLGLDWAYGFDRLDANGRRAPKWQLHFRLGQLF